MKKFLIISILVLSFSKLSSQVQINVAQGNDIESADLQIDSNDRGLAIPLIALSDPNDQDPIEATPKDGLLVYNTTNNDDLEQGYYIWQNNKWNKIGGTKKVNTITQLINVEVLSYDANGLYENSPATITLDNGVVVNKQKCTQWKIEDGGNNHYYCNYTSTSNNINFANAYNAARKANGYIITVTSDSEWHFIRDKVLKNSITQKTWLGYSMQKQPGNAYKYTWITGETFDNKWSNKPDVQHHFDVGQPVEASTSQQNKCTVINSASASADRLWISNICTDNFNNVIIEFNR